MGTGYDIEVDNKGRFVVRNTLTGDRHGRFLNSREANNRIGGLPDAVAPKRARKSDGTLKGDDPDTPEVNEAWKGGKAPKKAAKKRKAPAKKKK